MKKRLFTIGILIIMLFVLSAGSMGRGWREEDKRNDG